ncbi:hypothetical protein SLE2022_314220 [Rubroshorea leprosula]
MASKICMNVLCGSSTSIEWRRGWTLRSGDFANLCDKCGSAYEQSIFCDVFHSNDSGWRECTVCGKRLHCGCIASRFLLEHLDSGGVNCISCANKSRLSAMNEDEKCNGYGTLKADNVGGELQSTPVDNHLSCGNFEKMKLMPLSNNSESIGLRHLLQFQTIDPSTSLGHMKQEKVLPPDFNQMSNGSTYPAKPDFSKATGYESLAQTNLSISLGSPLGNQNSFPGSVEGKVSSILQQPPKYRHLHPKPPKAVLPTGLEVNTGMVSQMRVARPPAEGRGRNQLLPRYWPRITDQELQQISGDSNCTVVPLFEKVLSASDAGRIGRLVLPKACAEAYFPAISQPEGRPIKIQDINGNEWVFQFRFWPNNNSRMYVLEGVTPCIQSMQLQAGDTVTFSRMDPEGKLIMGFRKATNCVSTLQETQPSAISNGNLSSESFFSGVFENLPIISGYSGLLQSLKGSTDAHLNAISKHLNPASDASWQKSEKHEDRTREGLLPQSMMAPERKRARNIGSKSKRLHFDSLDALELKLTWEEAQDLLHPPPAVKPSIVTIEDHDFEEYEEPPVLGKRGIFVARATGVQEQWAQCDSCSKWRRLPVDARLPPKWTCTENTWDQSRSSCSAPDELNPRDLENLLRQYKDFKGRKVAAFGKQIQKQDSSGLDALANAAVLGDNGDNPSTTVVATTTRHPRHRPGCSCIVCIQPPSGKGKHKPTCTCTVCMTVKRRFKTLMMRKKKRQSEHEAEIAQKNQQSFVPKEEAEVDSSPKHALSHHDPSQNEGRSGNERESISQNNNLPNRLAETGKGHIDLNCDPAREEDSQVGSTRVSMMSLLRVATLPLETYMKENGLTSLVSDQQANSASHSPPQATEEKDEQEDQCLPSAAEEHENTDEGNCETGTDQIENDPS